MLLYERDHGCVSSVSLLYFRPKVAVVVVKKRINTRFFAKGGGPGLTNPPPGTVVDSEVTKPEW